MRKSDQNCIRPCNTSQLKLLVEQVQCEFQIRKVAMRFQNEISYANPLQLASTLCISFANTLHRENGKPKQQKSDSSVWTHRRRSYLQNSQAYPHSSYHYPGSAKTNVTMEPKSKSRESLCTNHSNLFSQRLSFSCASKNISSRALVFQQVY